MAMRQVKDEMYKNLIRKVVYWDDNLMSFKMKKYTYYFASREKIKGEAYQNICPNTSSNSI